nr:gonadotropin-releasing hormone II receptor-like isoform X5 [Pelodiscus sinensis]|eukprot:XP_014434805.1 gonadotropin-releasing hormone II receptor-like isoform X5 [Pelodiscus sinensis]
MNATFRRKVGELFEPESPTVGNQTRGQPWEELEVSSGDGANTSLPSEEVFLLPTFSTAAKVRVAITLVLFLSSACFNIAVLWTVTQKYRKRPHIRILIVNLATADLLVTFVVMPLDAAWNITVQWYAGDLACRALMFLKLVAMYASAFITVVISLDRQAAILHPLSMGDAKKKNKAMLCGAWALSVLLALPQMFVFHTVSRSQPIYFIQCATVGSFHAHWQETLYNMFPFSCLFLLPLLIMVLCYSRILIEISGKMKRACGVSLLTSLPSFSPTHFPSSFRHFLLPNMSLFLVLPIHPPILPPLPLSKEKLIPALSSREHPWHVPPHTRLVPHAGHKDFTGHHLLPINPSSRQP